MGNTYNILLVDDDTVFLNATSKLLKLNGYSTRLVSNSTKVLGILNDEEFNAVIVDMKMPGLDGIELTKQLIKHHPNIPVIFISGQSNIEIAVEAIKLGAFDFIEKPVHGETLFSTLNRALKQQTLSLERNYLIAELEPKYKMIGESQSIKKLYRDIAAIAHTDSKVLITGESGVGKELVARSIHLNSNRKNGPYVKINCAAIPKSLLESELFGHKKGAFTGATFDNPGKFKKADGGTLFLDEIGDMDISVQAKLLRVLEVGEIDAVGGSSSNKIDVRVIAATNHNLFEDVNNNLFRQDLLHRLNVLRINVDPLRKKKEDIPILANHFINTFNIEYNKKIKPISNQISQVLTNQYWEGNIRQLRNVVENIVIFNSTGTVTIKDVKMALENMGMKSDSLLNTGADNSLKEAKIEFEREFITGKLIQNNWNISETAKMLGVDRANLFNKMKKLKIEKA